MNKKSSNNISSREFLMDYSRPREIDDEDQQGDQIDTRHETTPSIEFCHVRLIPGFKGLGICLTPNGIINTIEPNSPSDKCIHLYLSQSSHLTHS